MHGLTIVFDLDGTLVDTAPDLAAATNHALADLGLAPVSTAALKLYVGHGARRMIVEALALSGRNLSEPEIDRLLALFLGYYEENIAVGSRPYPGAVETLEHMKRSGARLAICTNKRERLSRLLLGELGLAPLFYAIAGRDTFPVCKPDPGHLLGAVELAGGNPAYAAMVGDTVVDVTTARGAGVPVAAVAFGYSDVPAEKLDADIIVNHFTELAPWAASLRPRTQPVATP
jgi:phosphoglycolate phosphatase